MLAPPTVRRRRTRLTRGRSFAALAVSLIVLIGGIVVNAAAAPGAGPVSAQPPLPLPTGASCEPNSPLPICQQPAPTTTPVPTGIPLPLPTGLPSPVSCFPGSLQPECQQPSPPPCTGVGCLPQPTPTTTPPPGGNPIDPGMEQAECGLLHIGGCITNAINGFFSGIVTAALNPLLDLLSNSLLTTPTLDELPGIGALWDNSWQILLISYALLILIAGAILMAHETLQTRTSAKEIAPRLVVGFLTGALSLWVAAKGIEIANAMAKAVMGDGLDPNTAGRTLRNLVLGSQNGGTFLVILGLVLAALIVVLLVTYIVRVALTIILIAGAPLFLMFHALPQTEGIGFWWWKGYGGCLVIQIGQSMTLVVGLKVFLAPGGFTLFGPSNNGLVNVLVALALMYILFKIPFWVLGSIRGGGGRSLAGSLVRGFLAYKAFGLLGGRGGGGRQGVSSRRRGGGGGDGGAADPYANTRVTPSGQYVLPLKGVRRVRPPSKPRQGPAPKLGGTQGRQLALPLGDDWPENKPVLGRDGQYRLPLDAPRVPRPAPPEPPASRHSGGSRRGGGQMRFQFDPYAGNRATNTGQYPLPLAGLRRVPHPASPPSVTPAPASRRTVQPELPFDPYKGNRATSSGQYPLPLPGVRRTSRPSPPPQPPAAAPRVRGVQPELPFDPFKGNRADRAGQYPLPLEGVHRVPRPTPPPAAPRAEPTAPAGRQLRLPVDLPKKTPRTPPKSGGTKS
ncbi:hypothetical protein [Amycolatopsis sp. NPDC059657]|uniref:hypothetical protein n=1 Tax=Amycolatopsis sp. NPDC059657 TaxID=3346899 RepID=UPI0036709CE2